MKILNAAMVYKCKKYILLYVCNVHAQIINKTLLPIYKTAVLTTRQTISKEYLMDNLLSFHLHFNS